MQYKRDNDMNSMKEQLEQSDMVSYISSIRFRRGKNKNSFRTYERHKATDKRHGKEFLKIYLLAYFI